MFATGPSDDELKAIGLTREDVLDTSVTDIWPEHFQAYEVFSEVSGQWIMSMSGPVALNYLAVEQVMRMHGVTKPKKQLALLREIRVMERAALNAMNSGK